MLVHRFVLGARELLVLVELDPPMPVRTVTIGYCNGPSSSRSCLRTSEATSPNSCCGGDAICGSGYESGIGWEYRVPSDGMVEADLLDHVDEKTSPTTRGSPQLHSRRGVVQEAGGRREEATGAAAAASAVVHDGSGDGRTARGCVRRRQRVCARHACVGSAVTSE